MSKNEARQDPVLMEALTKAIYPGFEQDIVGMGLVKEAYIEDEKAVIKLRPVSAPPEVREQIEDAVAQALVEMPGVKELELHLPEPPTPKPKQGPKPVEGVKAVIAVASGKGGVGKSTVSVNLALGLAQQGLKVGILDLDLYGPSIPLMLGITGAQAAVEDGRLAPVPVKGIKALSVGILMGSEKALIWRGPLVMKAVRQLLHDVAWAPLDVLVLDLPPGTGDVQITMVQEVPLAGAVVVTTPQDVALADAIKAVDMFRTTKVPVLGIVENMSYFLCPDCGARHEIFGHGSVKPLCTRLGVPYLGELPLHPEVPRLSDQGTPPVDGQHDSGAPYIQLAQEVRKRLVQFPAAPEVS